MEEQDKQETITQLVNLWRSIIQGENKSWVLFEHGTCLILMQPEEDLAAQARRIMAEWGPVAVGTPSADFNTLKLIDQPGWVVSGHHPDMLNYVSPAELSSEDAPSYIVGLIGRGHRDEDARLLHIVHIEDKR
jgi:hypothetical protein